MNNFYILYDMINFLVVIYLWNLIYSYSFININKLYKYIKLLNKFFNFLKYLRNL